MAERCVPVCEGQRSPDACGGGLPTKYCLRQGRLSLHPRLTACHERCHPCRLLSGKKGCRRLTPTACSDRVLGGRFWGLRGPATRGECGAPKICNCGRTVPVGDELFVPFRSRWRHANERGTHGRAVERVKGRRLRDVLVHCHNAELVYLLALGGSVLSRWTWRVGGKLHIRWSTGQGARCLPCASCTRRTADHEREQRLRVFWPHQAARTRRPLRPTGAFRARGRGTRGGRPATRPDEGPSGRG